MVLAFNVIVAGMETIGLPGTTESDATDELEVPPLFVAVDVKEYEVPSVNPVIVQLVAGEVTVHVAPPGLAVTV